MRIQPRLSGKLGPSAAMPDKLPRLFRASQQSSTLEFLFASTTVYNLPATTSLPSTTIPVEPTKRHLLFLVDETRLSLSPDRSEHKTKTRCLADLEVVVVPVPELLPDLWSPPRQHRSRAGRRRPWHRRLGRRLLRRERVLGRDCLGRWPVLLRKFSSLPLLPCGNNPILRLENLWGGEREGKRCLI